MKKRRLNVLPEYKDPDLSEVVSTGRFPPWLHRKLPKGGNLFQTGKIIGAHRLSTVCEEAKCPNLLECWSKKTATFLTMGKECTRACGFCSISFNNTPKALDPSEPLRTAESVLALELKHVVLTMVARDDIPDGGANHLGAIVAKIREINPETSIELLTSDFNENLDAWNTVLEISPEIFNYNLETVRALTPKVRHKATYDRTLRFLKHVHDNKKSEKLIVKSGLMLGLGETKEQVHEALGDLKSAGCDIVTLGQYLQPCHNKLLVKEFITPQAFEEYAVYGKSIGIRYVYAGPFVRSSYNAKEVFLELK